MMELMQIIFFVLVTLVIFSPRLASTLSAIISVLLIFLLIFVVASPANHGTDIMIILALIFLAFTGSIYAVAKFRTPRAKDTKDPDTQVLVNYELHGACFSFKKGNVVDDSEWDLKVSALSGLATNNAELNKRYKQGGIIKLGLIDFDEIKQAQEINTLAAIPQNDIIVDHCYLVKTSSGQQFAKIQITKFNPASMSITFRWQLADDSGSFVKREYSETATAIDR